MTSRQMSAENGYRTRRDSVYLTIAVRSRLVSQDKDERLHLMQVNLLII